MKKFIPSSIIEQIKKRPGVLKILSNISWLILDKISILGAGLILGIFVTRYLGPKNYGLLNYASAFSAIAGAFVSLGLESIVIKELVKHPIKKDEILGSAFFMQLGAGFFAFILNILLISIIKSGDYIILYLVTLSSLGFLFKSINVIDLYYQSQVSVKYSLWARNASFYLILVVKIVLLVKKASVIAFAMATAIEGILSSIFLILAYKKYSRSSIFTWKFNNTLMGQLFKESWPLIFASVASIINMRIDQVMLGTMLDEKTVGIYAAATRISELWLMAPMIIGASIYPSMVAAREVSFAFFKNRVYKITLSMACVAIPFALIVSFFSNQLIQLLYGNAYTGAGILLSIHIWTGFPYVVAFALGQVFYIEKLTRLSLYTAIYTVISNITLNYLLIPKFGAVGSAGASLFSAISSFILSMILLNKHTKIFHKTDVR